MHLDGYAPDDVRGDVFYDPLDGSINESKQEEGERVKMVESEFGFVTWPRVAPRRFQGIVYSAIKKVAEHDRDKESKVYQTTHDAEYFSETDLVRIARNIAATMVEANEGHPERIIPIYDSRGYLLWPKYIPYSELKETLRDSLIKKIGEHKEVQ